MSRSFVLTLILALPLGPSASAQNTRPTISYPTVGSLRQADALVDTVFTALQGGRTQFLAEWLNDGVGAAMDPASRVREVNDYKSHLDIVLLPPPEGTWGALADWDLLEEAVLPGSDRFFRRTYIAYHDGAPMVWQFLFYVRPDGDVSLNGWNNSPGNPFEFLSTPDMLLNSWYDE